MLLRQGYRSLNRIQSIVYPTAYKTNENMLVCGALVMIYAPAIANIFAIQPPPVLCVLYTCCAMLLK